jgi:PAS domain S-box-containing protein
MRRNRNGAASRKKNAPAHKLSLPGDSRTRSSAKTRGVASRLFARKRDLDDVIERYADLYDFAPTGYVSFDRSGRIAEINLTAAELLGLPRHGMIGMPFAAFVLREDLTLFLHHLLQCRNSSARVETVLRLKNSKRKIILAQLWSTPITASPDNGAVLFQTSIVDLTERNRAEKALRESDARTRAIIEQATAGMARYDMSGRIIFVNLRFAEMLGYEPSELAGKTIREVTHPDDVRKNMELFKGMIRDGKPFRIEKRYLRKDGTVLWADVSASPIRDDNGNSQSAVAVIVDVTARKKAESAAIRLAAVVQSSHDAIVAKDLNGIITDWNRSAERIFGYKAKEIIGKPILTLIPQDLYDEEKDILQRIGRGESIEHYETIRRRKDGRLLNVSLTISPIKDLKGEIVGASKIARDITKQKQVQHRLAEQARLLDLSNEGILIRDKDDRIRYWNQGAVELYGYSAGEAVGKISHKLLQTEYPELLEQIYKKFYRNDRWSGELGHRRKDGTKIVVMSRWANDRHESGERAFVLETNSDITARKHAELALRRSKKLLEKRVRERTSQLHTANKELKSEIERRKGLEGEILSVSDREQQRLGQELHDGICQHLTAVAFMAPSVATRLRNHRVIDAADIEKIADLVNSAATDTRNLSRALHRINIDAAGLVRALQDLVDREIWRTPCRLEVTPSFRIEDDAVAGHFYRIAREAVINANKHAQARQVMVKLERSRQRMILRVIDDGVGFTRGESTLKQGLGFHIMNYRAQLMGAVLKLSLRNGAALVSPVTCRTVLEAPSCRKTPIFKVQNHCPQRLPVLELEVSFEVGAWAFGPFVPDFGYS